MTRGRRGVQIYRRRKNLAAYRPKATQHISRINHPNNPEVVWVAAQGPLHGAAGRGVYKTTDGGKIQNPVHQFPKWC